MFHLSPYFLVTFFQDWISLKQVCRLDSTICNKNERIQFHHILKVRKSTITTSLIVDISSPLLNLYLSKILIFVGQKLFLTSSCGKFQTYSTPFKDTLIGSNKSVGDILRHKAIGVTFKNTTPSAKDVETLLF